MVHDFLRCLRCEQSGRERVFGKHDQTRGVLVQPPNGSENKGLFTLCIKSSKPVGNCIFPILRRGVNSNASGFVEDKEIVVLIQNLQGDICLWNGIAAIGFGQADAKCSVCGQTVNGANRSTVYGYPVVCVFEVNKYPMRNALPPQKTLDRSTGLGSFPVISYNSFHR